MTKIHQEASSAGSHIEYIDVLRVLSMISVVFLHTAAGSLRSNLGSPVWHVSNVLTAVMSSSVPIFFMISGAMILSSEKTLSIGFTLKKRLSKAFIPFLSWSLIAVLYFLVIGYVTSAQINWSDMVSKLRNITSQPTTVHLWFMYALIPLYVLSPILKKMMDSLSDTLIRYLMLIWIIFSSVIPTLQSIAPAKIQSFLAFNPSYNLNFLNGYLGYFMIGYILLKVEIKVPIKLLTGIIIFDTVVISLGTWYKTSTLGEYSELFKGYSRIFMMVLSIAVFLLLKELFRNRHLSVRAAQTISVLSSASFGIYLFHNLLVNLISKKIMLGPAHSLLTLFGCFFAVLLLSLTVIIIAASLKPTCYLLTGLTYENACKSMNVQYFINKLFSAQAKAAKAEV